MRLIGNLSAIGIGSEVLGQWACAFGLRAKGAGAWTGNRGRAREAGRLDVYECVREPTGLSRTVLLGGLRSHPGTQGLPPTGLRDLPQDRSPPHICDASRARPSSGRDG